MRIVWYGGDEKWRLKSRGYGKNREIKWKMRSIGFSETTFFFFKGSEIFFSVSDLTVCIGLLYGVFIEQGKGFSMDKKRLHIPKRIRGCPFKFSK